MFTARTEKLLVCVSAQQATAACWRRGRLEHMERFPRDEGGLAQFREFLAPHPGTPVSVLVDAVDEDYRFETLPHCFGAERRQMVARKLKQHYRNTPYMGARLQGREARKRRDDRYLFCALKNPDFIDEWLRVVHGQALPLAGVYLLPMVSSGLPDRLHVRTPNLLMASAANGRPAYHVLPRPRAPNEPAHPRRRSEEHRSFTALSGRDLEHQTVFALATCRDAG